MIIEQYAGRLLISESACFALPQPLVLSRNPVGETGGLRFRVALAGFGYEIEDPTSPAVLANASVEASANVHPSNSASGQETSSNKPRGWVSRLRDLDESLAGEVLAAGIWDDDSYQDKEEYLSELARTRLGLARFFLMTGGEPSPANIVDNIQACPPWFTALNLNHLPLTVRQANVFRENDLLTVADLGPKGTGGLLKLDKMGRTSVSELAKALYRAFTNGPSRVARLWPLPGPTEGKPNEADNIRIQTLTNPSTRLENVRDTLLSILGSLNANERDLLSARMGLKRKPSSLAEIADQIGVTRERVRQIETKICNRIKPDPLWEKLRERLNALLEDRCSALLLEGLSGLDPWFEGCADLADPFEYIFDRMLDNGFFVLNINESLIVSRLSQAEWDDTLRSAKRMLDAAAVDQIPEEEARYLIDGMLASNGADLREELWAKATEYAHFISRADGQRVLAAYGRSAESVVLAILAASDQPLHYSEIQRRSAQYVAPALDIARVRNASAEVGVLYARGTYGLLSHCPLDKSELALVRAETEDLLEGDAQDRQWHSAEIREALYERGLDFDGRLTKYVVNVALGKSDRLVYLRRMVWGLKSSWRATAASRIDMRQAVIALLQQEGRPMTTAQIRAKLEAERGVNALFQIHAAVPLIRVGPGVWGLSNRDLGVTPEGARFVAAQLVEKLRELNYGIHVSELLNVLSGTLCDIPTNSLSPHGVVALAQDYGVKIDRGQYVYLSEWGESRRMTIQDGIRRALSEIGAQGLPLDQLIERVNDLTKRHCSRETISQLLQAVDACWDVDTGSWRLEKAASIDEDLENA
jgi:hypothetical protein